MHACLEAKRGDNIAYDSRIGSLGRFLNVLLNRPVVVADTILK